ncbi:MAG: methionine synthase [Deltaproteobacteria bacterium]|nr:MAG: methionine synthase [Deltaproteobacteria bacterium]
MSRFLDTLDSRVLILDGAMGTSLQNYDLPLSDYNGLENCSEILCITRPDVVMAIHESYLEVGCDAVETNSFGGTRLVLAEFGLEDQAYELNKLAAELARQSCDKYATPERPRFVVGSMGPGTKLPSLLHVHWDELFAAYAEQARGLLDGGADVLLVETCQDILQTRCALAAIESVQAERPDADRVAVMAQVTMETTGTMLVGTEIGAALAVLDRLPCDVIGLNCATGPQEMAGHIAYLARHCKKRVSVLPNAGLPQLIDGHTHYPLTPDELANWHERFVSEDGVQVIGGCCGTTPAHLKAVCDRLWGKTPAVREPELEAQVTSLYSPVALHQDADVFAIGERTNANGSRRFKRLLDEENWDGIVRMGKNQAKHGSHAIDVCTAYVGRDEVADMSEVLKRFNTDVPAPIVLDSTELNVLEEGLKLVGGRAIINSINLEDGEERLDKVCRLARIHGSAVIALTIDEEGMAKTAERKLEVAKRLYDLAVNRHGLHPADILFDPLTFTICTGNEDDRKLGVETLDGIRLIREHLPECGILLGLSNISFGVNPAARHVLNSVYLHHAREAGLSAAILHMTKIMPLFKVDDREREVCEDLIFDRRREGYDPLQEMLALFADAKTAKKERPKPKTVEERLKARIIDGDRVDIEVDLAEAMKTYEPLHIINELLLDGMRVVGELFGAGQMQLPFVLQSAETMKAAVAWLEPHMEKIDGQEKGSIVLATVRGDVHDIGKNLVDIILSNNGYKVHNIGIKQPLDQILKVWRETGADAIGMSGLLVKSTVIMKENLEDMRRQGLDVPVVLGGAALTKRFVEADCSEAYGFDVTYAKDAFSGLYFMDQMAKRKASGEAMVTPYAAATEGTPAAVEAGGAEPDAGADLPELSAEEAKGRVTGAAGRPLPETPFDGRSVEAVEPPKAPFYGSRVVEKVAVDALVPFINENVLYKFQWGFARKGLSTDEWKEQLATVARPIFHDLVKTCIEEDILRPQAVYGYFPCNSDGDEVVVYHPEQHDEVVARLPFPRMDKAPNSCIADYFQPIGSGVKDVIGFTCVTMGEHASEVTNQWFEAHRYRDYLYLHGLSVEMTEALAEFIHRQMRAEMGISGDDAREIKDLFHVKYRGCRYSFGYPACPEMAPQRDLLRLLGAERIGVNMDEDDQLHPEQSTSALVVHHPAARYFKV